jgi:DNA-binding NarL/FixJ family response regulator
MDKVSWASNSKYKYYPYQTTTTFCNTTIDPKALAPELNQLTDREQEVLHLIATGATNREIAQQLYIAEGTVKTHVTHLFNRLSLRNRVQLAIYAKALHT